jgi:nucleoside-diphosphate-sugar epimerase
MKHTLLSLGHGYTARALARELLPQGWRIIATSRTADTPQKGVDLRQWPGDDLVDAFADATHILSSIPPGENGDPVLNGLADQIATAPKLKWIGYLSTTAVYGDHKGEWVDETTPLQPATKRGEWRVAAERAWQDLARDQSLNLNIFRLAGIYGPGRGPFAKLRAGTARRIIKPGQVFSRIHVFDITQTLIASMNAPHPGAIYNVCDDDPAPPQDVLAFAAELLGLPVPPAENWGTAKMSPMARSFYGESKRVSNDRIKTELGVRLRYPDFKTGLRALAEE